MSGSQSPQQPPWLSPDGRFYWDGSRWVQLERRERGPSVLATATLAAILIAGSLWVLNNTQLGASLRCRFLNDAIACLGLAFDQVVTVPQLPTRAPARTESPEEKLRREEEERRSAAASDVRSATDVLLANAADLESLAGDMTASAEDVTAALSDIQTVYDDLGDEVSSHPMDSFQQQGVCFALDGVAYAREGVDYAVESYGFDSDSYLSSVQDHTSHVAALESAVESLRALVGADPGWTSLYDSSAAAITESGARAANAEAVATEAAGVVQRTVAAADDLMKEARGLAKTVADC